MKIYFPKIIIQNINQIYKLFLEISNQKKDLNFSALRNEIHVDHVKKINFIELFNYDIKEIKTIQWRIIYKNNVCEIFTYDFFFEAFAKPNSRSLENGCIRCKGRYDASYIESKNILERVNSYKDIKYKFEKINNKNLIYYCVYFDSGYVDLLELSIESLLHKSKINFEILIITDEKTKNYIIKKEFAKKIILHFLITKTPEDGWKASEKKLDVFNFKNINDFDKILYLDCDIICNSDISNIFDIDLYPNILYTAFNKKHSSYEFHRSPYYGFSFLDSKFIKEMAEKRQRPFNAGQFLFKNCWKMKNHFHKVKKLIKKWNGEYFFEQSFVNYYFCSNNLTNYNSLINFISVIDINEVDEKKILKYPLIHFSAPPIDAKTKINFIKRYLKNERLHTVE